MPDSKMCAIQMEFEYFTIPVVGSLTPFKYQQNPLFRFPTVQQKTLRLNTFIVGQFTALNYQQKLKSQERYKMRIELASNKRRRQIKLQLISQTDSRLKIT